MSSVRDELESFHHFAADRLASGDEPVSLDELFAEWQDAQSRDEINAAIRRGLADVEAGRFQDADEATEAIRQEFGLAKP